MNSSLYLEIQARLSLIQAQQLKVAQDVEILSDIIEDAQNAQYLETYKKQKPS